MVVNPVNNNQPSAEISINLIPIKGGGGSGPAVQASEALERNIEQIVPTPASRTGSTRYLRNGGGGIISPVNPK